MKIEPVEYRHYVDVFETPVSAISFSLFRYLMVLLKRFVPISIGGITKHLSLSRLRWAAT
jgi:hypothetical protein